jgi:ATP adenylyltransferase
MTFKNLIDLLENRMSISHIYQPLLIRALVDSGGTATIRQPAQSFLLQDEIQLLFYEKGIGRISGEAAFFRKPSSGMAIFP